MVHFLSKIHYPFAGEDVFVDLYPLIASWEVVCATVSHLVLLLLHLVLAEETIGLSQAR